MNGNWRRIKPGERTLTVLFAIFGITVGVLVSLAIVLAAILSNILFIFVAPVMGGTIAGCFSRGNLLLGAFTGFTTGTLVAAAILGQTWILITNMPMTGGAGLAAGLLLLLGVVVAVTSVVFAVIGGFLGVGVSKIFGNYRAEQSCE